MRSALQAETEISVTAELGLMLQMLAVLYNCSSLTLYNNRRSGPQMQGAAVTQAGLHSLMQCTMHQQIVSDTPPQGLGLLQLH